MEDQTEPIYHNLFFDDLKKKIDNYVKFRRECVEIAILVKFINENDFKFVSVIDPNIIRRKTTNNEDNNVILDSKYLDTDGYLYESNQDFMTYIQEQQQPLFIIFQGYIDKKTDFKANKQTDEILSKLSIRKMMFVDVELFNTLLKPDVYYEKNTLFHSYLDKVKKNIPNFELDKNNVDDFLKKIIQAVRTGNVNFDKIEPILDLKQNNKSDDYKVINEIIRGNIPKNFIDKYISKYLDNHEFSDSDYIEYFSLDKPSYKIYDLIKDSYMTIQLDTIIIETQQNGKTQKNKINLESNKALNNLNKIFDNDYFKEIKTKKKDINILFLFYEKLLKKDKDDDEFLKNLLCIFYSSSIEYSIINHNKKNEKNEKNKIQENNADIAKLIQVNIVDAIYHKLKQLLNNNTYTLDDSCKKIQTQFLDAKFFQDKKMLKELQEGLAKFMTEMDNTQNQNQNQSDENTINELETDIIKREDIINKMIDIKSSTLKKYLNYTLMTLGVFIAVAPIVLTIVVAATTGSNVSMETSAHSMFSLELLNPGPNITKALNVEEK